MIRRPRVMSLTAVLAAVYVIFVWWVGGALGLTGANLWILRGGLWLLGLAAAGLVVWFFGRAPEKQVTDVVGAEIDRTFDGAKSRLHDSRAAGGLGLNRLPMVIVLGPQGSAKTTTIVQSGLDPDLLAGEVFRGSTIAPTGAANLWYTDRTVFVEMGGSRADERNGWNRLLRGIQPQRLQLVFTGKPQAPRVAVVCFSCEELVKSGSSEAVPAAARALRERLIYLSRGLGIRLPVYVVFTKADRVPYFADFVEHLTQDEAQDVLGATLPTRIGGGAAAAHADVEFKRVKDAFLRIFASLAEKRLKFLPREATLETAAGVYEFPREFRKITDLASQFLVELCKPSQLSVSPFLRGFYFTGVRAVIVSDAAPAQARQPVADHGKMGATQVFDPFSQRGPSAPAPAPGASRKIPQWVFLSRLFRDVVLRDHVAMGITRGGVRLNVLRRLALASIAVVSSILMIAFIVSYSGNRRLQRDAGLGAAGLVGMVSSEPDLPNRETLAALDAMRASLAELSMYRQDGPPLRLRWGLYKGSRLIPDASAMYKAKFEAVLLNPARVALQGSLRRLAASQATGQDSTYMLLKAYLMTTQYTDSMQSTFLAPILLERWVGGRVIDQERIELARNQFAFYEQLCRLQPCQYAADPQAIALAQSRLTELADDDIIYQTMLAQASAMDSAIVFNDRYPGSADYVVNRYVVPAAFTDGGWQFMRGAFNNIDAYLFAEPWVVGEQRSHQIDRAQLTGALQNRYHSEYIQHWRTYLDRTAIARFSSVRDASRKLGELGANDSPLMQLLALASQNTAVDSTEVGPSFQPLHTVTAAPDQLLNENNQPYLDGLQSLQNAVAQVADGGGDAAVENANSQANTARGAVQSLARGFGVEGEAPAVGDRVRQLMEAPIQNAQRLLSSHGLTELNRLGARFCRQFQPLLAQFPFSPQAARKISIDDMTAAFQPGGSMLWSFFDETLVSLLERRGNTWVVRSDAPERPTPQFLTFFSKMAGFSDALFQAGDPEPQLSFAFRPELNSRLTAVRFSVDGVTHEFTRSNIQWQRYQWRGSTAREVRLEATFDGRIEIIEFAGAWALFEFFQQARGWQPTANGHRVEWIKITQGSVSIPAVVALDGRDAILRRDYFDGTGCVARIAR